MHGEFDVPDLRSTPGPTALNEIDVDLGETDLFAKREQDLSYILCRRGFGDIGATLESDAEWFCRSRRWFVERMIHET